LKFHHIPGVENRIADGLSRLPVSAMEVGIAGKEEELVDALVVEKDGAAELVYEKEKEKEGFRGNVVQEDKQDVRRDEDDREEKAGERMKEDGQEEMQKDGIDAEELRRKAREGEGRPVEG
jgi:hypothetical protein